MSDDPTTRAPVDPWIGSAPVTPPPEPSTEPYVMLVVRPRRRRWPWVLAVLASIGLVCVVGAIVFWIPIAREYPAHLELGETAAGLDRIHDAEIDAAADELVVRMFREFDADDGLAAVLEDPGAPQRRVILLAATKLFLNPAQELEKAIGDVSEQPVTDVTDYHRLGPLLKCGNTVDDQAQAVIVCAWLDHGSVGAGIFYGDWTMDDAATTLRDLRAAVVRRG